MERKLDAARFSSNARRAFTLIELLVVIAIIAVLTALVTVSLTNAQQKGRDGKRKTDLKSVQQALETYFQTYGKFPDTNSGQIRCNSGGDTATISWGGAFVCNSKIFMSQLPRDPKDQITNGYYYNSTSSFAYVISTLLENTRDPDLTGITCAPQSGRNYCVIQQ